jgi:hypothetical protein
MTLFENPVALEKTAMQLEQAIARFEQRLLRLDIDDSGPFIGKPHLTLRDDFREIRDTPLPEELKQAWLRWAFRFSEAKVNASVYSAITEAYRIERHIIDPSEPTTMTLQEIFFRVLSSTGQREYYLEPLARQSSRLVSLVFERWARRVELARRAGFSSLDEVEAPCVNLEQLAESLLTQTDSLHQELVPATLEGFLDRAHAKDAHFDFAAKLSPRSLRELLGNAAWLEGLELRVKRLPLPLSPASFCRGLMRVGSAMVDAAAPQGQPFVVARDPGGLLRRKMGALLGGLPQLTAFGRHRLALSRPVAQTQARCFAISGLLHVRTTALSVLLRARFVQGRKDYERDYESLCHRTFGFSLPQGLAGFFPRVFPDAGQRFLGPCLASQWSDRLTTAFDEDWFRNPRGIESIRQVINELPCVVLEQQQAQSAVDHYVRNLIGKLD